MKHSLGISTLSVVCVMCATFASGAYGAASVRALGGAGTYNGSAAASTATSGVSTANVGRAGSLRVSPSSSRGSASVATTTKNGSAATSQRLSIGKYLGGSTSVSGGSSNRPGTGVGGGTSSGGVDSGTVSELTKQIDDLHKRVNALGSTVDDKQDALRSGDGIVEIDGDEVSVNVVKLGESLKDTLDITAGQNGREVIIGSNTDNLLWKYVGDDEWTVLIPKSELIGPRGEKGEPGVAADMDLYSTTEDMNKAIKAAIDAAALSDLALKADVYTKEEIDEKGYLTEHQSLDDYAKTADVYTKEEVDRKVEGVAAGDMEEALKSYAKSADVYTKEEIDEKGYLTEHQSLDDYAKTANVYTKEEIDEKGYLTEHQSLDDYAKTANVYTKEEIDEKGYLTEHQSLDDYAKTADVYTKEEVDRKVEGVAAGDMEEALKSYAKSADVYTKEEIDEKGYLTEHQSLDDYAKTANVYTKEEIDEKGYLTEHQSLDDYAKTANVYTKDAADEKFFEKTNPDDKLGALAVLDTVTNENVADTAAIAKTKLASDVQTSLDNADKAGEIIPGQDRPIEGDWVLAVSDGVPTWMQVIDELDTKE